MHYAKLFMNMHHTLDHKFIYLGLPPGNPIANKCATCLDIMLH